MGDQEELMKIIRECGESGELIEIYYRKVDGNRGRYEGYPISERGGNIFLWIPSEGRAKQFKKAGVLMPTKMNKKADLTGLKFPKEFTKEFLESQKSSDA